MFSSYKMAVVKMTDHLVITVIRVKKAMSAKTVSFAGKSVIVVNLEQNKDYFESKRSSLK